MKIALLGPAAPFRGGIANFAAHLADELGEMGHEIRFFNFVKQYPAWLFPSSGQEDDSLPRFPAQRVLTPYNPFTWQRALKEIKAWEADLIIVSWWLPFFAFAYYYLLKRLKVRKVILAHNIRPHENWLGWKLLLQKVFNQADSVVVLSKSCYEDIKRHLPNMLYQKSRLGFHPIYSAAESFQFQPDSNLRLLFFGLIKTYKGLDILLDAMPLILKELPDAKLLIAGSVYGSEEPYLQQIQRLGLQRHVEHHFRYLSDEEVAGFFSKSDLCVLPYKSATQSGVIATAFSYNTPVIASDVGGLGEYIDHGNTGLLVPPEDPQALADAIIRFQREQLHAPMQDKIAKVKAGYSWRKLAELMIR